MESFTISSVFEYLQNQQALQNPRNGGFRFGRKERVEAVFPKRVCDKIAARSASYYSWFLNKDKQGVPIRDYLRRLFEEDSYEVFREMEDKCSKLLISPDGRARISEDEWRELLALLGREVPLFVRGSEGEGRLEQIAEAVPARALACLFLVAGMGGMTQAQYEQLLTCWRLMDRNLISGEDMEPMRHVHAGELLYLDGNRGEALNQLIKAAVKLREGLRDESDMDIPGNSGIYDRSGNSGIPDGAGISGSPCNSDIPGISGNSGIRDMRGRQSDRELLGRVLLRIGEIYLLGGEDGEDEEQAQKYLDQSVSMGCTKAYIPLAMLQWKKGQIRETRETLLKGAGAGVLSCLRTLGNSFYRGNEIACNKKDLRQAAEIQSASTCWAGYLKKNPVSFRWKRRQDRNTGMLQPPVREMKRPLPASTTCAGMPLGRLEFFASMKEWICPYGHLQNGLEIKSRPASRLWQNRQEVCSL